MNSQKRKNQRKRTEVFKVESGYIALAEAVKNSPYSQEYLSLLARQGKLQAKKFGRNWYITQTALDDYLTNQGIKRGFLTRTEFLVYPNGEIYPGKTRRRFADKVYQHKPKGKKQKAKVKESKLTQEESY